jgi:biotin carboxyl carrier protein
MLYHVTIGARTFRVEIEGESARVDDTTYQRAELVALPGTRVRHLLADGTSATVVARRTDEWDLQVDGWTFRADVVDERTRAIRAMTARGGASQGPRPVRAPMPGLIVQIEVGVGDSVIAGQGVAIMEAMKMENELRADAAGVVSRILVEPGQAVEKGAVLVEFHQPES